MAFKECYRLVRSKFLKLSSDWYRGLSGVFQSPPITKAVNVVSHVRPYRHKSLCKFSVTLQQGVWGGVSGEQAHTRTCLLACGVSSVPHDETSQVSLPSYTHFGEVEGKLELELWTKVSPFPEGLDDRVVEQSFGPLSHGRDVRDRGIWSLSYKGWFLRGRGRLGEEEEEKMVQERQVLAIYLKTIGFISGKHTKCCCC